MPADNSDLLKAVREATPGPWEEDEGYVCVSSAVGEDLHGPEDDIAIVWTGNNTHRRLASSSPSSHDKREANARYIAAANPTRITALLEQVTRLESELAEAERLLAPFRHMGGGYCPEWTENRLAVSAFLDRDEKGGDGG